MRLGTLIPHFGRYTSKDAIVRLSSRAEALGFDSLWVRDHLLWKPHGIDGRDETFIDPFIVLSAAAAVTERVELGTAVVIPVRWPLKLAQEFANLSFISGGRVAAGIGLGFNPLEFAAAGFKPTDRELIFTESVEILRQAWAGRVTFEGLLFQISDVEIEPKPAAPIPILYGGTTPAGTRRAVRYTDGWYCGRLPMATLERRLEQIKTMPEASGRNIRKVIQPLVLIDDSREAARRRIPVRAIADSSEGAKFWVMPESGRFETAEDLEGLIVWGNAADIVEQTLAFARRGIDDVVFDLRLQFDEYEAALEEIGKRVLPGVRSALHGVEFN